MKFYGDSHGDETDENNSVLLRKQFLFYILFIDPKEEEIYLVYLVVQTGSAVAWLRLKF